MPQAPVRRFSKSKLEALGDRLRAADVPSEQDLRDLSAWRDDHAAALEKMKQAIAAADLGIATPRLKNTATIIDKLRREPERPLHAIRDIAGLRIVSDELLSEQNERRDKIAALVPNARIIDRCAQPNHGYRAQHVVVRLEGNINELRWLKRHLETPSRWSNPLRTFAIQLKYGTRINNLVQETDTAKRQVVERLRELRALL